MTSEVIPIAIKGVMPTANGFALFLGNDAKTFVIYVDHSVGNAMQLALGGVKKERPLTHDLIGSILTGLDARLEHVIINHVNEGTFFARILIRMENEVSKKLVEIDARPSDSLVLAIQLKRPVFVARAVFEAVEDMTEVLENVLKRNQAESAAGEEDDDEEDEDEGDEESGEEGKA